MKQILLLLGMVLTLHATDTLLPKEKWPEVKKLNIVLEDPALTIMGVIEKPESYVLKLKAETPRGKRMIMGYLIKSTSELYIGSGYIKDGHPILFPINAKAIRDGVVFSYGSGPREIYLVTDPECPYCAKFAKKSAGKMANYTVHVIFFPLSFHKSSPAMIEWILRGKNDAEKKVRYEEIVLGGSHKYAQLLKDSNGSFHYSDDVQKSMDKASRATTELNVRGTPMLFDADFNPLTVDQVLNGSAQ